MIGKLLSFLGFGGSQGLVSKVTGGLSYLSLAGLLAWLLPNANKMISFQTSYGFFALIVGFAWLVLEVVRRN